jgi:hypothetical protein
LTGDLESLEENDNPVQNLLVKNLRKNISFGLCMLLEPIFICLYYSVVKWIEEFQESFQ